MNLLDVQDKIKAGEYRSDRFPAVPFVTFEDVLKTSSKTGEGVDQGSYPSCGATLTVGSTTHTCALRLGHTFFTTQQHDWARWL